MYIPKIALAASPEMARQGTTLVGDVKSESALDSMMSIFGN